jgi:nitrilase
MVPSAFLTKTGATHWETLLRTRAIENQCYVVASAQMGRSVGQERNFGYGHSMVVDPWGDIVGQMSDQEGFFVTELDLDYLDNVRTNMNSLTHIREELL